MRLRPLVLAWVACAAFAAHASTAPELTIEHEGTDEVRGLGITADSARLDPERKRVRISGKFERKDWTLVMGNSVLVGSDATSPDFVLEVPMTDKETSLLFMAVDPNGETEMAHYRVFSPSAPAPVPSPAPSLTPAPDASRQDQMPWSVGLSFTRINYEQLATFELSEWALTLRAGYTHVFSSKKWELGISGFGTLLPFGVSAPASFVEPSLRFIGINARMGYRLRWGDGWNAALLGGIYYTTTSYGGNRPFGFRNLAGPQVFPVISKLVGATKTSALGGYLKFSPVAENLNLLTLANRELALGMFWRRTLGNGHPFSYSLDWSTLALDNGVTAISVNTISVGATYGF